MPRRPDVLCAGTCGRLIWRGRGCLPPGQAMCRACKYAVGPKCAVGPMPACSVCRAPCSVSTAKHCSMACRRISQKQARNRTCTEPGCVDPAKRWRYLCSRHDRLRYPEDPERAKARSQLKTYRRKDWMRLTDITPEYVVGLRAKAKHCPLCRVKLLNKPYLSASKELDHIIPRCAGGTHTIGNVRIICRRCNLARPNDGSDYTGPVTLWAEVA